MKIVIFSILLCLSAGLAFGQKADAKAYKIRAKGFALVVNYEGKAHILPTTSDQIDAARITETETLFADRKDGFTYLVVNVSGWSKGKQDDRQCGAGIESNLLWLKLDSKWKLAEVKSVRYESCWSGVNGDEALKIEAAGLDIEFDNFRDDLHVKLTYDSAQPEKGFQIEETKLKEN